VLAQAYGAIGRVRKERTVFLVGNIRIHVDRVEGLGDFVELEVVLSHADTDERGVALADELLDRLGVAAAQRVAGSYLDLLQGTERSD
jgi:predicted adenylyl cyclase CyaB